MRGSAIAFAAMFVLGCGSKVKADPDATDTLEDTGGADTLEDTGGADSVEDTGETDAVLDTASDMSLDTASDTPEEPECVHDGDCDDSDPCTVDTCDTGPGTCAHDLVDADADGYPAMDADGTPCTGGTDCDDTRAHVNPGQSELNCNGLDDDCSGEMSTIEDEDQDGYANVVCLAPGEELDCAPVDESIHPGAPEICDTIDQDCDGEIIDAPGADDDSDGYMDDLCGGDDCDDREAVIRPGAPEHCFNGIDDDCDGSLTCDTFEACNASGFCERTFVTIAAGTFTMGAPASEPGQAGDTRHLVTLTRAFEIMAYEVTQGQFVAMMGYNPSWFTACGMDCPVAAANWYQAAAFANAMSASEGLPACFACTGIGPAVTCSPSTAYATPYDCPGYRLPTEAEWEYAARAGTSTGTYNGTSTLIDCTTPNAVLDPIAWFCGNSGVSYAGCHDCSFEGGSSCAGIYPVGGKAPNAWLLFDMLGNVQEWCHDYGWSDPGTAAVIDPWGLPLSGSRIRKGGNYCNPAGSIRAAGRTADLEEHSGATGLRIVRTLP